MTTEERIKQDAEKWALYNSSVICEPVVKRGFESGAKLERNKVIEEIKSLVDKEYNKPFSDQIKSKLESLKLTD